MKKMMPVLMIAFTVIAPAFAAMDEDCVVKPGQARLTLKEKSTEELKGELNNELHNLRNEQMKLVEDFRVLFEVKLDMEEEGSLESARGKEILKTLKEVEMELDEVEGKIEEKINRLLSLK